MHSRGEQGSRTLDLLPSFYILALLALVPVLLLSGECASSRSASLAIGIIEHNRATSIIETQIRPPYFANLREYMDKPPLWITSHFLHLLPTAVIGAVDPPP